MGNLRRLASRITKRWAIVAAAAIGIVPTAAVITTGSNSASAATPAVSTTLNPWGFPTWYQDATGTRVEPCLDGVDQIHCVLPPDYDAQAPLSIPGNFPEEFFYQIVDAAKLTTPGCPTATDPTAAAPGLMTVRFALEGAFANGAPAAGDQMVFGRIRVVVKGGLCPGMTYTFQTPYGDIPITTNETGSITPTAGTIDVGCVPSPLDPCNFVDALGSKLANPGFLRWDGGNDPGYLGGDIALTHTITGGVGGFNRVTVRDDAGDVVTGLDTDQFAVSGKLAGPLHGDTQLLDVGAAEFDVLNNAAVGTAPTATTVLTNIFQLNGVGASLAMGTPVVTGGNEGDFHVVTSCDGTTVEFEGTCAITVEFVPTALGARTTTLEVPYTEGGLPGLRSPYKVELRGTGTTTGATGIIDVSETALDLGIARVGTITPFSPLTVTNVGDAPMKVTSIVTGGTDGSEFRIGNDQCTSPASGPARFVQPLATCDFSVAFQPTSSGAKVANVTITAEVDGDPVVLNLTAEGVGGKARNSTTGRAPGEGINSYTGFPFWYEDDMGKRLGECIDPFDPYCTVLTDDFYSGGATVVTAPPDRQFLNFPEEYFYWVATSGIIDTPGCGDSPPGKAFVRLAAEAAFSGPTGGPIDGDQMVFGRTRLVVTSGLCANTTYEFTFPYGKSLVTTDADGGVRRNAATNDVGCLAGGACNWDLALQSDVFGSFLSQINPPPGYLGDPNVLTQVTGSPYLDPDNNNLPANYLRIHLPQQDGSKQLIGETDVFDVMGKLVGPIVADPTSLDFGTIEVGTGPTPTQTVTFTNDGQTDVTTDAVSVSIEGALAGDFHVTANTCDAVVLGPLATCAVTVEFEPQGTGPRAASLKLHHDGNNNPTSVALTGKGATEFGSPAISVVPLSVDFTDLHTGQISASESVRISNAGGSADLLIGTLADGSPAPLEILDANGLPDSNFVLRPIGPDDGDCSLAVIPEAECVLRVAFQPTTPGVHTAFLHIHNNTTILPDVVVTLKGRGFAGAPAQSNQLNVSGHQTWYQDDNGVRLEPCLDPADANCVVLPDPDYTTAQPQVFPSNFPEEFFWQIVDSDIVQMDGGGTAMIRMALEGTFTDPANKATSQTQFVRWRVTADGLAPNTSYDFITPWGTVTRTTDGDGALTANQGTIDQDPVFGVDPELAGGSLATGFLRWDPTESAPPAGYLGVPTIPHTIIGSRYIAPGDVEPSNSFRVRGSNGDEGRTDQFLVSGKIAGPIEATPTSVALGSQAQDTVGAVHTVSVTNLVPDPITITGVTVSGPNADEFVVNSDGCTAVGVTVALDASCTIDVQFAPLSTRDAGPKSAVLEISQGVLPGRAPITVALSGTSVSQLFPHMVVSPTTPLGFASIQVGNQSLSQQVRIDNTGNGDLDLTTLQLGGANAGDFLILPTSTCSTASATADVLAGGSCVVNVAFRPTATGNRAATLSIAGNDSTNPSVTINLSGSGIAAVASGIPASVSLKTKGSTSQTIKITNTGTAPLSLVGAPALVITGTNANRFTASNTGCNNVAPGRSCNVTVTFNAPANGNPFTATLTIKTNAANNTAGQPQGWFTVTLNGTRG